MKPKTGHWASPLLRPWALLPSSPFSRTREKVSRSGGWGRTPPKPTLAFFAWASAAFDHELSEADPQTPATTGTRQRQRNIALGHRLRIGRP